MADDNNRVYQKLKEIEPGNTVVTNLAFGLYESARDEFIREKEIKSTAEGEERLRRWKEDWTEQRFRVLINTASTTLNDFSHIFLSEYIEEQKQKAVDEQYKADIEKVLGNQAKVVKPFLLNVLSSLTATILMPLIIILAILGYFSMDISSLKVFLESLFKLF